MRARVTLTTAVLTAAGLLLTACGGTSDNATTSTEPTTQVADEMTEASKPAIPEPTPTAEPPPEPEPTPTGPTPITSDDLIDVLPRPGQMSNIQDRKFKRSLDGFPDEPGADWAADAPLTKKQRGQINLGDLRKTKPAACQYAAFVDGGWMSSEWSGQDYITAAAHSWMVQLLSSSNLRQANLVKTFQTRVYVMPPGEANIWLNNTANTLDKCKRYKQVDNKGKIENVETPTGKILTNGTTYVWDNTHTTSGIKLAFLDMWEVVGNALLVTRVSILNPTAAGQGRAVKVFNNIADKLAKTQGITRDPLVLDELTKVKQDPSLVREPTWPASSLA